MQEGIELANEYGVNFYETSAKTDTNVELAFTTMASHIKARVDMCSPTGGTGNF